MAHDNSEPFHDGRDETAARRLGELLHRLRGAVGPSPEDVVGIDLPRHQLRALFIVARHGPISVGNLAQAIGASLASTSSLADRLVRSGHLQRQADPADRRRVLLVATDQGNAVTEQMASRFHARFARLVEAMTPEGRAALETGLTDMIRAAEASGMTAADAFPTHGGHA
jgi:DNA-binding MarR family transcriptional regulator